MRYPRRHSAALTDIKKELLLRSALREEMIQPAEGEAAWVKVQRLTLCQLGGGISQRC